MVGSKVIASKKEGKKRNNLLIISKLEDRLGSLPRAAAWEIIGDS